MQTDAKPSTEEKKPTEETKPQRDGLGRWVKGNDGGPGNPFGRHLARARVRWNSMYTPENIEDVFNAVLENAKAGKVESQKLFVNYLLGKPTPAPDPDHVDIAEFALYAKADQDQYKAQNVLKNPDHRMQLELARIIRPIMADVAEATMKKQMAEQEEKYRRWAEEDAQAEREEAEAAAAASAANPQAGGNRKQHKQRVKSNNGSRKAKRKINRRKQTKKTSTPKKVVDRHETSLPSRDAEGPDADDHVEASDAEVYALAGRLAAAVPSLNGDREDFATQSGQNTEDNA